MRATALKAIAGFAALVALSGCTAPTRTAGAGPNSAAVSIVVEPDSGFGPVYDVLASAQHSLDMTMYELSDPRAEAVLASDEARGVDVRVLFDRNREAGHNARAYQYLKAKGVSVRWAPVAYEATHEKAMVVDGTVLVVMTANLVEGDYSDTRDFVVSDRDGADVSAADATFAADWEGVRTRPAAGDHLVWSPGSESRLVELIDSATRSVAVENEELADPVVADALERAGGRGVDVTVTMTDAQDWHREFASLAAAGVKVTTFARGASLYIHAKVIVIDAGQPSARAFVGSENFSAASLDRNRELGLITTDPTAVHTLATVLDRDHAAASPWSGT